MSEYEAERLWAGYKDFIDSIAGLGGWAAIDEHEIEKAKELGFDVLEETA